MKQKINKKVKATEPKKQNRLDIFGEESQKINGMQKLLVEEMVLKQMKYDFEKFKKAVKNFKPSDNPPEKINVLDGITFFKDASLHIVNQTTGATFDLTMENPNLQRIKYIHKELSQGV